MTGKNQKKQLAKNDVSIRLITFDDLETICEWLQKKDILTGLVIRKPVDSAEEVAWFERYQRDSSKEVFAIECEGRHVGNVSLFNIDEENGRAMLSIFIGEERLRGKGIGTEAIKQTLNYAFTTLSLKRVWLEVLADAAPAIRCYEKAGMKEEGLLRSYIEWNGERSDMKIFSILAQEFFSGANPVSAGK